MENNTVEVTAKIDQYMRVTITIPKEIDAIRLSSILQRLQKMLKLSPLPESLQKISKKGNGNRGKRSNLDFMNDRNLAVEMVAKWKIAKSKPQGREEIAKKYGMNPSDLEKKIYYARSKFDVTNEERTNKIAELE